MSKQRSQSTIEKSQEFDDLLGEDTEEEASISENETEAVNTSNDKLKQDKPFFDEIKELDKVIEQANSSEISKEKIVDKRWIPIDGSARTGTQVFVSDKPEGEGVLSFWKKTRAFANNMKRWQDYGKFVDALTGYDLPFKPEFFRHRFE
jgi:hypothetical protein